MSDYNPFERPLIDTIARVMLLLLSFAGLLLMPADERGYLMSVTAPVPFIGSILFIFFAVYALPVWLIMPLMKKFAGRGIAYDAIDEVESIVKIPLVPAEGIFLLYRKARGLVRGEGEDARSAITYLFSLALFASLELRALFQGVFLLIALSLLCVFLARFFREIDPFEDIRKG